MPEARPDVAKTWDLRPRRESAAEVRDPMKNALVLVVEDDPDIAELISLRVSRQGHRPTIASNAASAIEEALARPPDLVLLDLHLPDRHGWDVLDRLRHHAELSEIPVLVVSIDDPDDKPPHPVQGHLTKPFRAADLDRAVSDILGDEPV